MGDYQNIINTAVEEATIRGLEEGRARGLAEGRAEGREVGRAEGRAEGMEKERLANATKMKELGVAIDVICQVTGLAEQDVAKL